MKGQGFSLPAGAGMILIAVLAIFLLPETQPLTVSAQGEKDVIRAYGQKRWSFDIQNGVIRFSHGNHLRRDRWFRAYFGSGYADCANCHQLELPEPEDGKRIDLAAEIRKHRDNDVPYGIQEETCLTCHNNVTAPADCQWCHVQGSQPLQDVDRTQLGDYEEQVDTFITDYNEAFLRDRDRIGEYREKKWSFDIQNNNVRFSHGNHKSRDRWFKAYFDSTYQDCGNCHNLGLPYAAEDGLRVEDGEHLNTVEDIRDYEDDIYPFGIMMARCFESCHNGLTAPNDCMNCHLPGSRALTQGTAALSNEMQTMVVQNLRDSGNAEDAGERIFADRNCNLCHLLNGSGVPLATGLSAIGNRRDSDWLAEFLRSHQEQQPRTTTPKLILSKEESQALARYLTTLK